MNVRYLHLPGGSPVCQGIKIMLQNCMVVRGIDGSIYIMQSSANLIDKVCFEYHL